MKAGDKIINRYEIEAFVGEGATATVYRARDLRLGRVVAVKALSPYVSDTALARFSREAKSAAALNHPGIMAIYDQLEEGTTHYLIVEYIEGKPLSDFVPSAVDIVARIGIQLCDALDYAHRMNIIHRDIKPANIKVTAEGKVKIMDFGLAMPKGSAHITAHGSIIGTPAYLSPEQARGHDLDHRTDIYSLGVMLYEMLTGALPFDGTDIGSILMAKVTKNPPPPSSHEPDLPLWLDAAIAKALERDRDQRFQTALEFAEALGEGQQPSSGEMAVPVDLTPRSLETLDQRTTGTAAQAPARVISVVVADDHAILRTTLAMYLDDQPDIQVLAEAGTGEETLAVFEKHQPDVLLLDLNMPGRSGLEILPELRRAYPKTYVLVLTGRSEDAMIMRALQAGAHGYLLKTSTQEELVEAVQRVSDGNLVLGTGVAERVVAGMLSPTDQDPLSDGERRVLLSILAGHETNQQIASCLSLTTQEVTQHVMHVIDKMGVENRTEAVLAALRAGWITVDDAQQL